ncbi:MAG: GTP 3',8-cyclase MoaA [Methanobrevibacter boviskoreani]|uniref:GTP 3',8-cyclase MoaA n=2 Tax=Methanobrevibacter boviskoreani TaxID=1348249 RepID=UPI003D8B6928
MTVKDNYDRPIISFRMSITNRCNVNCLYCHHDGMLPSSEEMTPDEIAKISEVAKTLGVKKIRISGGEPLIRKDIVEIIDKINKIGFKDISITTNGTYLAKYAEDLKDAGLNRVNVSLDTLNRDTYKFITHKDYLQSVKEGILKAVDVGLYPVKINMVLMKDINQDEVWEMFDFCREHGLILQIIELMESESCEDNNVFSKKYHYNINPIEEKLAKIADDVKVREFMQDRRKYYIGNGEIEIVKPMDNTRFCKNCSRLRLTPSGKIKPCLLRNDNLTDIIGPLRNGASDDELREIFLTGINKREPYYNDNRQ